MDYYVLQVAPRAEEKTEMYMKRMLSTEFYDQCFHPMRYVRKKIHGRWIGFHEKLLPGYVFLTTENAAELYLQLKKIPLWTRLLGRDLEYFVKLQKKEEQWLDLLMQRSRIEDHAKGNEVGLSMLDVGEGNEIRIMSGPLADMQGMIRKINLHKMIAEVEVPFMNGNTVIHLGVEVMKRNDV